jgi:carbamoyl-phosphate synthase large subunit
VIGSGPDRHRPGVRVRLLGHAGLPRAAEEGYRVILVNSNPATIMTDPEFADATYVEPLTPSRREGHRARAPRRAAADARRPDRAQPRDGAATSGRAREVRRRADRRQREAIRRGRGPRALQGRDAGDRPRGAARRASRHTSTRRGGGVERARLPGVIRPRSRSAARAAASPTHAERSFAHRRRAASPPARSPRCSSRSRSLGWKEYELEVMRDRADNVRDRLLDREPRPDGRAHRRLDHRRAAQTLTDVEYQRCATPRSRASARVGVETGGSNIQFAVEPGDGDMVVIEMNPRVSRSSRWRRRRPASRSPRSPPSSPSATRSTRSRTTSPAKTPASFEPTLDYVVVKVPRFAFEKFPGADPACSARR